MEMYETEQIGLHTTDRPVTYWVTYHHWHRHQCVTLYRAGVDTHLVPSAWYMVLNQIQMPTYYPVCTSPVVV